MTSSIHELIGDKGVEVLNYLLDTPLLEDYYLAGGTGLAFFLRHRRSLDMDFFCKEVDSSSFSGFEELEKGPLGRAKILQKSPEELSLAIKGVKITFLYFPFPLCNPLERGEEISPLLQGLNLASPKEILLMKAYALGRRASFRDYIDLYIGLSEKITTLKEIIQQAKKKFVLKGEVLFSTRLFLEQLVYTEDIEDKEISLAMVIHGPKSPQEVQEFLEERVQEYLEDPENLEGSSYASP